MMAKILELVSVLANSKSTSRDSKNPKEKEFLDLINSLIFERLLLEEMISSIPWGYLERSLPFSSSKRPLCASKKDFSSGPLIAMINLLPAP